MYIILISPAWDDTSGASIVSPHAGLIEGMRRISLRRLKSTVNKVTSLRDFATNKKRAATPVAFSGMCPPAL